MARSVPRVAGTSGILAAGISLSSLTGSSDHGNHPGPWNHEVVVYTQKCRMQANLAGTGAVCSSDPGRRIQNMIERQQDQRGGNRQATGFPTAADVGDMARPKAL